MATHPEVPVTVMGLNTNLKMRYRRNMCDVYVRTFNYFVKLKHMSAFLETYLSTQNVGRRYRAHSSVPLQNYTITHDIGSYAE